MFWRSLSNAMKWCASSLPRGATSTTGPSAPTRSRPTWSPTWRDRTHGSVPPPEHPLLTVVLYALEHYPRNPNTLHIDKVLDVALYIGALLRKRFNQQI